MSLIKTDFANLEVLEATDLNTNFSNLLLVNEYNEDLTTLTDGIETTFQTAFSFKPGTLRVYLAGLRVRKDTGTTNFVETLDIASNGDGFIMSVAPGSGVELVLDYQRANA